VRGEDYTIDEQTDRLFTFTVAGVSGVGDMHKAMHLTYVLSQMEDSATATVDDRELEHWREEKAYLRFVRSTGEGVWTAFHPDGGATVIFESFTPRDKYDIFGDARKGKFKFAIPECSRPLVALSLVEAMVFRRMHLRRLQDESSNLIMSRERSLLRVRQLTDIHGRMLQFQARLGGASVSTARAGREQFKLWSSVAGLDELEERVAQTIAELHSYFAGTRAMGMRGDCLACSPNGTRACAARVAEAA
jgi:hypothetical protein